MITIRTATAWDACELAATMRPEDAAECQASGGYSPLEAVLCSMRVSRFSHVLLMDDQVAAIWGVAPFPTRTLLGAESGIVWALTSTVVDRHRKTFWRVSREVVSGLSARFPRLVNAVDGRYTAALRWVARLGFEVGPPLPFGAEHRPFHFISYRRPHV